MTTASRRLGQRVESELAPVVIATIHPSAILRAQDEDREREFQALVHDLRAVAKNLR